MRPPDFFARAALELRGLFGAPTTGVMVVTVEADRVTEPGKVHAYTESGDSGFAAPELMMMVRHVVTAARDRLEDEACACETCECFRAELAAAAAALNGPRHTFARVHDA